MDAVTGTVQEQGGNGMIMAVCLCIIFACTLAILITTIKRL